MFKIANPLHDRAQEEEVMEYVEREWKDFVGYMSDTEIISMKKTIKIIMRRYDLVPRGE